MKKLDRLVATKVGFARVVPGHAGRPTRGRSTRRCSTRSRGLAQSPHKWGTDLRLLAHRQEIDEPFEAEQVGSSAMAYKRNPMRAERMCSLARFVMGLPAMAAEHRATQWFERTLDDSACRRLYIPQAFLAADAVLRIALNLANGLVVNRPVIAQNVREHLPYMATENLMMAAVRRGRRPAGGSRGRAAAQPRGHGAREGGHGLADRAVRPLEGGSGVREGGLRAMLDPRQFVGRSPEQVAEFLADHVEPIRKRYARVLGMKAELHV